MIWIISTIVCVSFFCLLIGLRFVLFPIPETDSESMKRRLWSLMPNVITPSSFDSIVRQEHLSTIDFLDNFLKRLSVADYLKALIRKAGNPFNVGTLVLTMMTLMATTIFIGVIIELQIHAVFLGAMVGYLPIKFLKYLAKKRIMVFQEQFPEAMDLMTRALRSGHSFASAMKMVADERGEPISGEFERVFEDYSLGKTMDHALSDLLKRIDLSDVKFFVTAVLLQRETGGNLTEVLENISHIIRERFKLIRTVKALSAEGRLSGIILGVLAPALLVVLYFCSPEYVTIGFQHPLGQMMLAIGAVFEVLGILVIKKFVTMDV